MCKAGSSSSVLGHLLSHWLPILDLESSSGLENEQRIVAFY